MSAIRVFSVVVSVFSLALSAQCALQSGNQFDAGIILGGSSAPCTPEDAGTMAFNSTTDSLYLCTSSGAWKRVGSDEEVLQVLSQVLINQQRLLSSSSGGGGNSTTSAQAEQNRLFCSGHGTFQRIWDLNDPASCVCYDDDINGHHTGERCRDCKTGWQYSETTGSCTDDVDECAEETHTCGSFSQCVNTDGAYECPCVAGYAYAGENCEACPPGRYWVDGNCQLCPTNTYQPFSGSIDCIECPANSTNANIGSSSLSSCICNDGFYDSNTNENVLVCEEVGFGYYAVDGSNEREICVYGEYTDVPNANGGCSECPENSQTATEGSTDINDCLCEGGFYDSSPSATNVTCSAVPVNFYSPTADSALYECPGNSSNALDVGVTQKALLLSGAQYSGTTDQYLSTGGGYTPLRFGSFSGVEFEYVSGYVSCNQGLCGDSTSPVKWQTCNRCSANDHGNIFSFSLYSVIGGNVAGIIPQTGFSNIDSGCTVPDRVSNPTGNITCAKTFNLNPGDEIYPTWYEARAQTSTENNGGTITVNVYGVWEATRAGQLGCACGAGYYDPDEGDTTRECVPVGAGYFSAENSNSREPCPVESYSSDPTASECLPCPPGYEAEEVGATNISDCSQILYGLTAQTPGLSCHDIQTTLASHSVATPTGNGYYVQPVGYPSAQQVYCDMTTRGGGWTLVGNWENEGGYAMYSFSANGIRTGDTHTRNGPTPGGGVSHYSQSFINSLFNNGESKYMTVCGSSGGGSVVAELTKNSPNSGYDAYRGVYDTHYTQNSGFTMQLAQQASNSNPVPSASLSFSTVGLSARTCSGTPPPSGVNCYHYLPDDATGGGQWLFRENMDDVPRTAYGGASNVPSLLFIK